MPISVYTDPAKMPHRSQPKPVFDKNMGEYYQQLPAHGAQLNALEANAVSASNAAIEAATEAAVQAAAAKAAVGAAAWVSGRTYQKNEGVISQVNFQTYRRRIAGAGTTDPANDSTNWAMLAGNGSFIPQSVPAGSINLALGNYHFRSMGGNTTLTIDNCPQDGYSFTLELEVNGGLLTLPSSVKTPNNATYTLTAGKVHVLMFVTKNRGARWRMTAATNYDI